MARRNGQLQPRTVRDDELEERRRGERAVATSFVISMIAAIAMAVDYGWLGASTQVLGITLAIALGAMGVGVVIWADHVVKAREVIQERHPLPSPPGELQALQRTFTAEIEDGIMRRTFLVRLFAAAGGTLGLAMIFPLRSLSLGSAHPGNQLRSSAWRAGDRLVGYDNQPIKASALEMDGVVTVFPQNQVTAVDSVAVLLHVQPNLLKLPPKQAAGAPGGLVCYSKICTHAGCPVGLYQAATHLLFCPCHQSQFDVLRGARPVFGPAAYPLPQLPIGVDSEGYLIATAGFNAPPGPPFWERGK